MFLYLLGLREPRPIDEQTLARASELERRRAAADKRLRMLEAQTRLPRRGR